jgi:hypothetical protein
MVDWGLRLLPFRKVQRWAEGGARRDAHSHIGDLAQTIRQVSEQVKGAARNHLYPMSCLRRSLVLQRMLRRRGISAELRIGASLVEGQLQAHAWLEYAGMPIGEPQRITERFAPLLAQEQGK